jgi:hypothetical protein
MKNGKRDNNPIFLPIIICVIGIFAFVVAILFVRPAFYGLIESTYLSDRYMSMTIFATALFVSIMTISFAVTSIIRYKKHKADNADSSRNVAPITLHGNYDNDRAYLENKIDILSSQLVSSQKQWEKAFHLVLSSNSKSTSNSGNLSSEEFLLKYGVSPDENEIDSKLVFVLTPFSDNYVHEYYAIRKACDDIGLKAIRGDETEVTGDILAHIIRSLAKAQYVIANINGRNPNVFYELGIAHMMNKQTILISRSGEKAPFNVQSMRVIFYKNMEELRILLEDALHHSKIEYDNLQYDKDKDITIAKIAEKIKRIITDYRHYPARMDNTLLLLEPFFHPNSAALQIVMDGNRFKPTFIRALGKSGTKALKVLLHHLDMQFYKTVDWGDES